MYRIVWMYDIRPETAEIFERVYGPEGDWVRLFRTASGYLGSELFRSVTTPGRYLTVDDWAARAAFEVFRGRSASSYAELDARCDELTLSERLVSAGESDGV
ncbi:MAG TPA: antibiotic biosynthesis monooxygenase family protein [Gemmatimonadales bacterium]|jgi:heme-degrading monooxygenase HmoA|nr:antibiotic biosynthesis monooxygenase family protein [Gemmatimonadales bacterium]